MSGEQKKSWFDRLKDRWQVDSRQAILILITFALTGTTVMLLKKPIQAVLLSEDSGNTLFTIIYYILILPVYNLLLLFYGSFLGQFEFFWKFEKRMLKRIFGTAKSDEINKNKIQ